MAAQMQGLDIRILSITILLSLVFLSRSLVDCMFAFNLINEQLNSFMILLCIIIFSEVCTSVAIVKLMLKGKRRTEKEINKDNNFFALHPSQILSNNLQISSGYAKRKQKGFSHQRQNIKTDTHSEGSAHDQESLNGDNTSYGSFNPNLEWEKTLANEAKKVTLLTPGFEPNLNKFKKSSKLQKNYL